jgi:hypothetical protein
MDKIHICNNIACPVNTCSHKKPHKKRGSCALDCMKYKAHCELINQGFNPEEIILKSFGSVNG